jgi:hypothetical protein
MMEKYAEPGAPVEFILDISQEILVGMVGTTRSRVRFFMNRLRNLGFYRVRFIEYKDRIRIAASRN